MKCIFALILSLSLLACSTNTTKAPDNVINKPFPKVQGTNLAKEAITIPDSYQGKVTVLLIGYLQKTQYDIDRWILGLLQADVPVQIVEVPTIAGMMPQMVQGFIDNGMRSGIPPTDWASVVTVYEDAQKIIEALGNERPQSARVVLLNNQGQIVWTSNLGYSAQQIMDLKLIVTGL